MFIYIKCLLQPLYILEGLVVQLRYSVVTNKIDLQFTRLKEDWA